MSPPSVVDPRTEPVERKFERVATVMALQRPDRMPLGDTTFVEYGQLQYGRPRAEYEVTPGEIGVSSDGGAHYTADGGVWALGEPEKYRDEMDVLNADPASFEVPVIDDAVLDEMRSRYDEAAQTRFPVPWRYNTIYTRATIDFDWVPFLLASAVDPPRFGRILDRFGEAALVVARGWASLDRTTLIAIHDDIAATRGPISSPAWFREYVFPWYRRLFDAIHEYGKKVLYISDGNYLPVIDDILAAGPDGLYIESSSMKPGALMGRAGKDKLYLIKSDNRAVDVGTPEDIRAEIVHLRELHEEYPGMMLARGGGNPPRANAEAFDRYYRKLLVYT